MNPASETPQERTNHGQTAQPKNHKKTAHSNNNNNSNKGNIKVEA